jgi:hypothetical protein
MKSETASSLLDGQNLLKVDRVILRGELDASILDRESAREGVATGIHRCSGKLALTLDWLANGDRHGEILNPPPHLAQFAGLGVRGPVSSMTWALVEFLMRFTTSGERRRLPRVWRLRHRQSPSRLVQAA